MSQRFNRSLSEELFRELGAKADQIKQNTLRIWVKSWQEDQTFEIYSQPFPMDKR